MIAWSFSVLLRREWFKLWFHQHFSDRDRSPDPSLPYWLLFLFMISLRSTSREQIKKKNRSVATYYHCKSFTNICAVVWTEIPLSCCPWACLLHMLLSEGFLLMSGEMRGAEIICGCLVGTSNLALNGLHMDLWSWEKSYPSLGFGFRICKIKQ